MKGAYFMKVCDLARNMGCKMNGGRENPYFPIPAETEDIGILDFCRTIAHRLKYAGYTVKDVRGIWFRSRHDAESLDILKDLTTLSDKQLRYILGINDVELSVPSMSITCEYAAEG